MKLIFTNNYGRDGHNIMNEDKIEYAEKSIEIKQNCVITNYDSRTRTKVKRGDLRVDVKGQSCFVQAGESASKESDIVNLNDKKLSIFSAIAALDGNDSDLSKKDIEKAKKIFNEKDSKLAGAKEAWASLADLGITDIRYDKKAGVETIQIGEDELIRIDFETKKEKRDRIKNENTAEAVTQTEQTEQANQAEKAEKSEKAEKVSAVSSNEAKIKSDETESDEIKSGLVSTDYSGVEKWEKLIKEFSKKSGYSEELLITFILNEGYTPVAKYKNENGGLCEVGFGHTTQAKSNKNFGAGFKITERQAFEWLIQDIKDKEDHVKDVVERQGIEYDELPQLLKDGLIDVAYNRGGNTMDPDCTLKYKSGRPVYDSNYDSLYANLKAGYYHSAAVRLRQEVFRSPKHEAGLRKRNVRRFLNSIKDMPAEKIVRGMDLFNRDGYYTTTLNKLSAIDRAKLEAAWDSIYNDAKARI